jgi:hypothetical protein
LALDSTPLEEYRDLEGRCGFSSGDFLRGFKAQASLDQRGLHLRVHVTTGNRHDEPLLLLLIIKESAGISNG